MTDRERRAAADIRTAITLLGGVQRLLEELPPPRRVDADRLLTAATQRLMKIVYGFEPAQAKLAAR